MQSETFFSFDTLEFGKAIAVLERHLRTPLSPALLRKARPVEDLDWLESRFREIETACRFIETGKIFPFEGISDISPVLKQAEIPGAICEGKELVRVLDTLMGIRSLRKSLQNLEAPLGPLEVYLFRLVPQDEIESRLQSCLEMDGTLKDSASPALKRLRSRIRKQRQHIQKRLEDLCRKPEVRACLQEEYFTERGGRYVLPVQSSLKRKVRGIQHGRSDTGTTAYIEPFELVEVGNALAECIEEEIRETVRIFKDLTRELGSQSEAMRANLQTVAELDLVTSLADYCMETRGHLPTIVEEGDLVLIQARHPLLLSQMPLTEVVSNDLVLPTTRAGIVITGPNTGGKTVVLKTAGLLCLLALSGIPIPCGPGTRIPLLGGILADIGDEQSIEQSLSTFSSHISRMKSFVETSSEIRSRGMHRPLVVLDELGVGTDPAEGSALGRAFLEELVQLGAWVLVATHLGDLKLFGHTHPGFASGSMRFDHETLSPTYEFQMDTVGESHGLEIAQRLGLPDSIVGRARDLLETDPNRAAAMLHRLTEERKAARLLREEVEKTKTEIEEKRATLVARIEQTARKERDVLERARKAAEDKIASAKRRVAGIEELIDREEKKLKKGYDGREKALEEREKTLAWMERDLERQARMLFELASKFPNFAPEPLRSLDLERFRNARLGEPEWKRILREINREEGRIEKDFGTPQAQVRLEDDVRPAWDEIQPQDTIQVEGLDRPVLVEAKDLKKKRLSVLVGDLRSEVPYDRVLRRVPRAAAVSSPGTEGTTLVPRVRPDVGLEVNLIGMTVNEMEPRLRKYLDEAVMSGLEEVRIVHGFGTGVLRSAVEKILREHPSVADFRRGGPYEGGGGATVALLKV